MLHVLGNCMGNRGLLRGLLVAYQRAPRNRVSLRSARLANGPLGNDLLLGTSFAHGSIAEELPVHFKCIGRTIRGLAAAL